MLTFSLQYVAVVLQQCFRGIIVQQPDSLCDQFIQRPLSDVGHHRRVAGLDWRHLHARREDSEPVGSHRRILDHALHRHSWHDSDGSNQQL